MNSCSNSALLAIVRSQSRHGILCRDRTALSRPLCFVVRTPRACRCAPMALSHALCLAATSLPLAQCSFPVTTPMNSVTTWDLLTMIELCHDLKFSCRDLVSIAYTPLYRDKEKSCRNRKLRTAFVLCRDIEELCRDMRFSFTPVLCRDLKAYVAIGKSPLKKTFVATRKVLSRH